MFNVRFLLIISFVLVGLGPATAQNRIYIDKRDEAVRSQKPSVYIRQGTRSGLSSGRQSSGRSWSARGDKLRNVQDMKHNTDKIAIFHAWQESGRRPETLEEIQSYAMSKRAIHQGAMLERRKVLIAHLEKQERLRQRQLASGGASRGVPDEATNLGAFGALEESSREGMTNKTRRTVITKPRVFVRPDSDDKPRGPYTNYR